MNKQTLNLRIGLDCDGISASTQALNQLIQEGEQLNISHEFSSDINKHCIESIKANFTPKILFGDKDGKFPDGDITKRDIKDVPDIDMYVAGFPCFVGGTQVLTDFGYKNIENVRLDHKLLTHTGLFQKILNLQRKYYKGDLYVLRSKNTKIMCTPEHPFLTPNGWKMAKELTCNDFFGILTKYDRFHTIRKDKTDLYIKGDYTWFKVSEMEIIWSSGEYVYNFEVENDNSYIVENTIVHNCQSFSKAGLQKGFTDPRGTIFFECFKVIKEKRPKIFVLENVKNLLSHEKGETFKVILNTLNTLVVYDINYAVLNAKDYGIPQSRPRVFIVGILKSELKRPFTFPKPLPLPDLNDFVDYTDSSIDEIIPSIIKNKVMERLPEKSVYVDFIFQKNSFKNTDKVCPCILLSSRMWNVKMHRNANIKELRMLQGISPDFKQVVSNTNFKKQLGNTICVNVLKEVFKEIFKAIRD